MFEFEFIIEMYITFIHCILNPKREREREREKQSIERNTEKRERERERTAQSICLDVNEIRNKNNKIRLLI